MSKKYYVSYNDSDFYVNRPNGGVLTRAANVDNAKYICAELNRLLHRIRAREEDELELFPPISLENSIKNTESAPKYDPCRKFREGDIVRLVEWNGRKLWDDIKHLHRIYNEKGTFTVHDDEQGNDVVIVPDAYTENVYCACPACLELVAPVEERELYSVKLRQELTADDTYPYCAVVDDEGNEAARFYCELYEAGKARAAAEAECARLNAEYRKEQQQ
jgi:hypothetical protein